MISNLCQQLSQIGVGVRGKLIVACLLALVLLGGSSCMLFDILVKINPNVMKLISEGLNSAKDED